LQLEARRVDWLQFPIEHNGNFINTGLHVPFDIPPTLIRQITIPLHTPSLGPVSRASATKCPTKINARLISHHTAIRHGLQEGKRIDSDIEPDVFADILSAPISQARQKSPDFQMYLPMFAQLISQLVVFISRH
jgi:hypothetical protein